MDAVAINVECLAAALAVPVRTEIPKDRPQRMVCVSRSGGTSDDCFDYPEITLLCWGISDADASGLAISATHALAEAAELHPLLSSSEVDTISRDEWAATGASRYRVVLFQVINR